jgi:TRAP-type mannitol/chloroaromatic compound transport system substrate-binding protein
MQRRKFLSASGLVGGAAATIAAPALAQSTRPEIRWRLASSYPKSLGTIYGAMEVFSRRVAELTDNQFKISVHPAGELMPALQVFDSVQSGAVQMGQSASYFYIGRNPAFGFGTALPFGLNVRAQNAWLTLGGGNDLLNEFYKAYDVHHFPAGNTGAQMAGWFRKEIKTVEDLKGLKFRVGGLAGMVLSKLGVVPQQLAAGDIYPALEKGVLDAAEFVGPYDDEKLGLHKIAKYYYAPGWWEGSATLSLFVNLKAYQSLPADYRAAIEVAAAEANGWMIAKYDTENMPAMRRLVAGGAQLRSFPRPVMDACYKAAHELYAEMSEKSPEFKKIFDHWVKFRDEQVAWSRITDLPFDNYMANRKA